MLPAFYFADKPLGPGAVLQKSTQGYIGEVDRLVQTGREENLEILFPSDPSHDEEVLASCGEPGSQVRLLMRYPTPQSLMLAMDGWGDPRPLGEPFPRPPAGSQVLQATLDDDANELRLRHGGRYLLREELPRTCSTFDRFVFESPGSGSARASARWLPR